MVGNFDLWWVSKMVFVWGSLWIEFLFEVWVILDSVIMEDISFYVENWCIESAW